MFHVKKKLKNKVVDFVKEKMSIDEFKKFLIKNNKALQDSMTFVTNPAFFGRGLLMEDCSKKLGEMQDTPCNNYYLYNRMCLYVSDEVKDSKERFMNNKYKTIYEQNKKRYSKGYNAIIDLLEYKIGIDDFWNIATKEKDSKKLLEEIGFDTSKHMLDITESELKNHGNISAYFSRRTGDIFAALSKLNIDVMPDPNFFFSVGSFNEVERQLYFGNYSLGRFYSKKCMDMFFEIKDVDKRLNALKNIIKKEVKTDLEIDSIGSLEDIDWPIDEKLNLPYLLIKYEKERFKEVFTFKNPKTNETKKKEVIDTWEIKKHNKTETFDNNIQTIVDYVEGKDNFSQVKILLENNEEAFEIIGKYPHNVYPNYLWTRTIKSMEGSHYNKYKLFLHCKILLKEHKKKFKESNIYKENFYKNRVEDKEFGLFAKFLEDEISGEEFFKEFKDSPKLHKYVNYGFRGEMTKENENWPDFKPSFKAKQWLKEDKPFNLYKEKLIARWVRGLYQHFNFECVLAPDLFKRYKIIDECTLSHVYDDRMYEYLADLFANLPEDIKSKKDIKTYCRNKLNEIYKCENGKIPYWAQEPEWPYDENNEPMIYIKTIKKGELRTFVFKNKNTEELKYVEQFY